MDNLVQIFNDLPQIFNNLVQTAMASPLEFLVGVLIGYCLITYLIKPRRSNFTNLSPQTSSEDNVKSAALIDGDYYIKGSRGNKYCVDSPSGLICNSDFPDNAGKFNFIYVPETGQHIIRGPRKKYCNADQRFGLICNLDSPSLSTTQFRIEPEAYPTATPSRKTKIYQPVKIYAHEKLIACADHGQGIICNLEEDKGYDTFTLIPAAYIENSAINRDNLLNQPITGSLNG